MFFLFMTIRYPKSNFLELELEIQETLAFLQTLESNKNPVAKHMVIAVHSTQAISKFDIT